MRRAFDRWGPPAACFVILWALLALCGCGMVYESDDGNSSGARTKFEISPLSGACEGDGQPTGLPSPGKPEPSGLGGGPTK